MRVLILIAVQVLSVAAVRRAGFFRAFEYDARPKASESAADCDLACGEGAPKNCVPDCNAAVYQCINVADTAETQKCRNDILKGIKRIRTMTFPVTKSDKTTTLAAKRDVQQLPNKTLTGNTTTLAADRKVFRNECAAACGDDVDSSCITKCETEMYQCRNSTLPHEEAEGKRKECYEEVLDKYKSFKKEWNATHGFVARQHVNVTNANASKGQNNTKSMAVHYTLTKDDEKMIKDVCNAACSKAGGGAPSSMCVTHCQTDMYRCIKETLPDEMDERKKCRKDTEAKYEAWGSSL